MASGGVASGIEVGCVRIERELFQKIQKKAGW
ncbi:hypothetical protein LCGC14_3130660, partial [marine sediment metagenome]